MKHTCYVGLCLYLVQQVIIHLVLIPTLEGGLLRVLQVNTILIQVKQHALLVAHALVVSTFQCVVAHLLAAVWDVLHVVQGVTGLSLALARLQEPVLDALHVVQGATGLLHALARQQEPVQIVQHVVQENTGLSLALARQQEPVQIVLHVPMVRSELGALGHLLVPVETVQLAATL